MNFFVATWNKLDISPNPYGHLGPCDNQILIPKKKKIINFL
jgi:hypothetical protein